MKKTELSHLNKLSHIIFIVLILVIEEEDTEKVLLEEVLYFLSKLLVILQTCIINIEDACFCLHLFVSFFIAL